MELIKLFDRMQIEMAVALIVVLIVVVIVVFFKLGTKNYETTTVKIGNKTINAEIADTFAKQTKGLMGRKSLPQNGGMLFVFDHPDIYKFWMFNTSIPLDIIWIDSNKTIVFIQQNTQPCFVLNCTSYNPKVEAQYVLEVNANYTAKNKISVGDKVKFTLS